MPALFLQAPRRPLQKVADRFVVGPASAADDPSVPYCPTGYGPGGIFPAPPSPGTPPPEFAGPSLSTAVREQWGLRLVPAKGPLKVIIVDSLQLPADNEA